MYGNPSLWWLNVIEALKSVHEGKSKGMHETCPPAPPAATLGTLGQLGGTGSARQNGTQTKAEDEESEVGFSGQQAVVWAPCPCHLQEEPTAEHTANSISGFDFFLTF